MKKENKRTSFIWSIPKDLLISLIDTHDSLSGILRYFDISPAGNIRTLKKRLEEENIDWSKVKSIECKKYTNDEIFIQNSQYSNGKLRFRILRDGLIDYTCSKCGLSDKWQNEEIVLQLDHINGTSNDNRLSNLRFMCPNCHSQTKTYGGKNKKAHRSKTQKRCECGKPIKYKSKTCRSCFIKQKHRSHTNKINWPSNKDLEKMLWSMPTVQVAKNLNISDKAIEKRCKKHNISKPGKGYWQKIENKNLIHSGEGDW